MTETKHRLPTHHGEIVEMPDKKTLEEFLKGFHGNVTVIFDAEAGVFRRIPRVSEGSINTNTSPQ